MRRKVFEVVHPSNGRKVIVKYDSELQEYQVQFKKYHETHFSKEWHILPNATYFTNDKQDATDTARIWVAKGE